MTQAKAVMRAIETLIPDFDGSMSVERDGTISAWVSPSGILQPTQAQIDAAMATVLAEEAANAYKGKRAARYMDYREYLDAKSKQASTDPILQVEGVAQEAAYHAHNLQVKIDIPKGS